jgi:hypothetical protein
MRKSVFALLAIAFWTGASGFLLVAKRSHTPEDLFLEPAKNVRKSPSYQKVLNYGDNPVALERAKIDYLIDRMRESTCTFYRNKVAHSGPRGAAHLTWKYRRKVSRIEKVQDFIEEIATRSSTSGELYLIKCGQAEAYPVRDVLLNELERLEGLLQEDQGQPIKEGKYAS